jgi:hypothetical protein
VGGTGQLYYNAAAGPLPAGAAPAMKVGINRWERMQLLEMRPAEDLHQLHGCDWWTVGLALEEVGGRSHFPLKEGS